MKTRASKKQFTVICAPKSGDLIELCTEKNVIFLFKAKKQSNITSLVKVGDKVEIKDGVVFHCRPETIAAEAS